MPDKIKGPVRALKALGGFYLGLIFSMTSFHLT